MNVLSFSTLLESLQASKSVKNASGEIKDLDSLLSAATLEILEQSHPGPYAFLMFDHRIDREVTEYVRSGSLTPDSGRLLVLFPSETRAFGMRAVSSMVPATPIEIHEEHCVMRATLRRLFPADSEVQLPGVLFMAQFVGLTDGVFVPLAGLDAPNVALRLRGSFAVLEGIQSSDRVQEVFAKKVSYRLESAKIPHRAISGQSFQEYLLQFWRFAKDKPFEILSVLK